MEVRLRPFLRLALAAVGTGALGVMGGCGGSPRVPVIEPAKNVYVIQNNAVDGVEADSVLAFKATASGATTPAGTLLIPSALVAFTLATGPDGEIYVGGPVTETVGEVLVYAPGSTGMATPKATLTGGTAGTFTIPLYIAVGSGGQLYVFSSDGSVESFAKGATSAAAPAQYLTYATSTGDYFGGMGVDDAGEIFVEDEEAGIVDVFAAGANGADAPARMISASSAGAFTDIYGMAVDGAGNLTLLNYNQADDPFGSASGRPVGMERPGAWRERFQRRSERARPMDGATLLPTALMTFAAGASGAAVATRMLSGALTLINEPQGVAVDELSNVYYEDYENGALTLMMFPPAATGNVAAQASMTSTAFSASYFGSIAAY